MNNPLSKFRTICEVLREINDICQGTENKDRDIRIKLAECEGMAKKMSRQLLEYNKDFIEEHFEGNEDLYKDWKRRKKKGYKMIVESKLETIANKIPSMGGREIGKYLREYASQVKSNFSVVEVGAWLGAGTAQICLGILEGKNNVPLFVYDRFFASKSEIEKAGKQGVKLKPKQNTLKIVSKFISNFNCRVKFNRCNITAIKKYKGEKIGMYVDDASKSSDKFKHVMKIFKKHFVPGETILVFMDYFYFEWSGHGEKHKYQFNYMQDNKEFEFIKRLLPDKSAAVFLYRGKK